MILTKQEKSLIQKLRQEEEHHNPTKVGYLKEDLFSYDEDDIFDLYKLYTNSELIDTLKTVREAFHLQIPRNTKFDCHTNGGVDRWYDSVNYGIEDKDSDWASKYLTNISLVKKKKVSHS